MPVVAAAAGSVVGRLPISAPSLATSSTPLPPGSTAPPSSPPLDDDAFTSSPTSTDSSLFCRPLPIALLPLFCFPAAAPPPSILSEADVADLNDDEPAPPPPPTDDTDPVRLPATPAGLENSCTSRLMIAPVVAPLPAIPPNPKQLCRALSSDAWCWGG